MMLGCRRTRPILRDHKTTYLSDLGLYPAQQLSWSRSFRKDVATSLIDSGHCREYVNGFDDVVDRHPILDCQNCLVDDVSRVLCENVNTQYLSSRCINDHFDQTSRIPDDDGLRIYHL